MTFIHGWLLLLVSAFFHMTESLPVSYKLTFEGLLLHSSGKCRGRRLLERFISVDLLLRHDSVPVS